MSQVRAIVDKLLTNASSAYIPEGYISELLLPFIGVKQTTGKLAKYGKQHLRIENSVKGGKGRYRQVESIVRTTTSYEIEGHGLQGLVTEEDYRNVEAPFDAERDEVMGISTMLWLEKEKVLADALANTAVLTQNTTLAGADQYSDYNNSTPIEDFAVARAAVRDGCGVAPNVAFMDWGVKNMLKFHPQLLDALGFKQARPGGLTDDELAKALDVQKVLIAQPKYNSAKEGQTDSLANIWGKHMWFAVCPDSAQPYQVSLGYRLGYAGKQPRQVRKWAENNPPESTSVLVTDDYDFLLSDVAAAYLIKDAIA
jgi:hypothetical protein